MSTPAYDSTERTLWVALRAFNATDDQALDVILDNTGDLKGLAKAAICGLGAKLREDIQARFGMTKIDATAYIEKQWAAALAGEPPRDGPDHPKGT